MGARLACLAAAAFALTATQAEALTYPSPYGSGPRAAVNASGASVVAWAGPRGVRAATGDRSSGFGAPTTLAGASPTPGVGSVVISESPQVGIDDSGTAIVVWETTRIVVQAGCGKDCSPYPVSTGVWASSRPAGAGFDPAVALAGPQGDQGSTARPRLAMSANGHAAVVWTSEAGVAASLRGPGGPIQPPQLVAPRPFGVASVAVTDAGEVLAGGALGLVVRPPNGSYAAPRSFPEASTINATGLVAANARGDALFAYPAATGGFLVAQRPAAGDWGATTRLPALAGGGLRAVAMTGSGDGVVTWTQTDPAMRPLASGVVSAILTAGAAPVVQRITAPDGSADGGLDGGGLSAGAGADVAVGWDRQGANIGARRVAQVALRRAAGGFGAPITLTPADGDHVLNDYPGVAVDARGVLLATWVDHHPGLSRVKAIWIAPDSVSPVGILETVASPDAPNTSFPPDHFASVVFGPGVKPTRRGFVGVPMSCLSTDGQVCEGTITLRPGVGKPRAGRARFRIAAGPPKRAFVGLSRRTRGQLRRLQMIPMQVTVVNTKPGGVPGRRTTGSVFVIGSQRRPSR